MLVYAQSLQYFSDSLWSHGLQYTRLICPWDSPGKNTGEGCHFLLQGSSDPGIERSFPAQLGRFFTTEPPGKPNNTLRMQISPVKNLTANVNEDILSPGCRTASMKTPFLWGKLPFPLQVCSAGHSVYAHFWTKVSGKADRFWALRGWWRPQTLSWATQAPVFLRAETRVRQVRQLRDNM